MYKYNFCQKAPALAEYTGSEFKPISYKKTLSSDSNKTPKNLHQTTTPMFHTVPDHLMANVQLQKKFFAVIYRVSGHNGLVFDGNCFYCQFWKLEKVG